ncbi:MAG: Rrf2 family transcriptional regulator [Kiritimatiellales bacterium]|nr:Rrf2 family transcriptional regulator [Kiritimatiellales bacterium]
MKISTRARYGTRALLALSEAPKTPASVRAIAEKENLSPKYLEKIMGDLKSAELVKVQPGKGYVLARHPKNINLAEVFSALEISALTPPCYDSARTCSGSPAPCIRISFCPVHKLLAALDDNAATLMKSLSLKDLAGGELTF